MRAIGKSEQTLNARSERELVGSTLSRSLSSRDKRAFRMAKKRVKIGVESSREISEDVSERVRTRIDSVGTAERLVIDSSICFKTSIIVEEESVMLKVSA